MSKACISFGEFAPLWRLTPRRRGTCRTCGFNVVCKSGLLPTHSTLPPSVLGVLYLLCCGWVLRLSFQFKLKLDKHFKLKLDKTTKH